MAMKKISNGQIDETMVKKEEFKAKALNNDVFLPKKKRVKTMMFHYIVEKIFVCFHGRSKIHKGNEVAESRRLSSGV